MASDTSRIGGLVFLFAGQGSQTVGMGADVAAAYANWQGTLDAADSALGFPLSKIMAEGPEEELRRTEIAQPAILTLSVAHARHLLELGVVPQALAGHSLGQYSALVVAGALDFTSAVRLVAERGRLMQETVPEGMGAMHAIVGLDRDVVYQACELIQPAGVVNVASHNAPGQTVISGARDAVTAAADWCEEQGGAAIPLAVSAPFHSQLLLPMVPSFTRLVAATAFTDPVLPVIDNVTARPLPDAASVRQSLIAQITAPVLFEESLRYLVDAGTARFVQCGPGNSLLGFAKRVARGAELLTFEEATRLVDHPVPRLIDA
jgi:[acyl-carrier-protein] S-malonyltransferase